MLLPLFFVVLACFTLYMNMDKRVLKPSGGGKTGDKDGRIQKSQKIYIGMS